jgi:O-methyltransferase involved in polyketide biosynthesis
MKLEATALGTVQETLLIPLWARAEETARPKPILVDPKASEIVASLDYDFDKFRKGSSIVQPAACILASVIDRWVADFLKSHPDGTVVEIGAGLDSRFERIDNGRVHWFDLDLPDSIELRRRFFAESDRRRFLACSVFNEDWIPIVQSAGPGPVMLTAEAVLMYFEEEQVKRLFAKLADSFPGAIVAFDACGTLARDQSRKLEAVKHTRAEFRWGINDPKTIESWDPRYRFLEEDSVLNYHRERFPWPVRVATWLVPAWRRAFTINRIQLG